MSVIIDKTPHLTTAMTGPLYLIEQKLLEKQKQIEAWFKAEWQKTPAPIYGSVDLRNAGFKLVPVDMNLFPAGFNNLNPDFFPISVESAKQAFARLVPQAKQILIIPEDHSRNVFYWKNMDTLINILTAAGFKVGVASLTLDHVKTQAVSDEKTVVIESLVRKENKVCIKDFTPDVILLNNDLSSGIPDILQGLAQPIMPPAELGWSLRLKSAHFKLYEDVCSAFSRLIELDPWLISSLFRHCGKVNFMQHEGEECLVSHAEHLFAEIEKKYQEYKINVKPFLILKADAGTYGMAVMTIHHPNDLKTLNRKQRTSMSTTKGGRPVSQVILQEGVYTFETWGKNNSVAEPVVYLFGERVVGGFYRVHKERGVDENLNSPGMQFEPLAFDKTCHEPQYGSHPDECQNRFYAYGVIARLSMLAAAREHKGKTP